MSLVVSDISSYGIIMVGDSAVTRKSNGNKSYHGGCVKVQFCKKSRIGFAIWGRADVGAIRMDQWLQNFVANHTHDGENIVTVGERLATTLNAELAKSDNKYFRRGIQLSGYVGKTPVLYHVHSGHLNEEPHELRLYRDCPDDLGLSLERLHELIAGGSSFHLRNGRFQHFAALFKNVHDYSQTLKVILDTELPPPDLKGRLEFYQMLVRFVAGVLRIAKQDGSVNEDLSWVAFDCYGSLHESYVALSIEPRQAAESVLEC